MQFHPFHSMSDTQIDAELNRRDRFYSSLYLSLFVAFVLSALTAAFTPENSWAQIIALIVAFFTGVSLSTGLIVLFGSEAPSELCRLDQHPQTLDRALRVLNHSLAARQLRDKILASGRSLRVFDVWAFEIARDEAIHRQKVASLQGA